MNSKKSDVHPAKDLLQTRYGFTLVEVMTVLVIIAVLAMFAAPEVINWRPKMRLKGAADKLSEDLQRAKIHAIKNNVNVLFAFTTGTGAPAKTCTGGSYRFVDANAVTVVPNDQTPGASITLTNKVCLQTSTFVGAPPPGQDGFTSRGLPINAAQKTITLSNADLTDSGDPTFVMTQSVAGGINLQRVDIP